MDIQESARRYGMRHKVAPTPHIVTALFALIAVGCASHPSMYQPETPTPVAPVFYGCGVDPWSPYCDPYYYGAFWPYPGYALVPVTVLPVVPIGPLPPQHKPPHRPPTKPMHSPRIVMKPVCRPHAGSICP